MTFEYTSPKYQLNLDIKKSFKKTKAEAQKSIVKIEEFLNKIKRSEENTLLKKHTTLSFRLKQVIEVKLSFVELLKQISNYENDYLLLQTQCLYSIESWKVLRTYLMKGKIKSQYDLEKLKTILSNIWENEINTLKLLQNI